MGVSPLEAGVRLRCPQCGRGRLFTGYLKFAQACDVCGANFSIADAGDGPAVFVILIVGAIATPLLFILQFGVGLPGWLAVTLTLIVATGLCLAALPPFKGVLFALQWRHRAAEAKSDDLEPPAP